MISCWSPESKTNYYSAFFEKGKATSILYSYATINGITIDMYLEYNAKKWPLSFLWLTQSTLPSILQVEETKKWNSGVTIQAISVGATVFPIPKTVN